VVQNISSRATAPLPSTSTASARTADALLPQQLDATGATADHADLSPPLAFQNAGANVRSTPLRRSNRNPRMSTSRLPAPWQATCSVFSTMITYHICQGVRVQEIVSFACGLSL